MQEHSIPSSDLGLWRVICSTLGKRCPSYCKNIILEVGCLKNASQNNNTNLINTSFLQNHDTPVGIATELRTEQ
jgi:hypothetical protein